MKKTQDKNDKESGRKKKEWWTLSSVFSQRPRCLSASRIKKHAS